MSTSDKIANPRFEHGRELEAYIGLLASTEAHNRAERRTHQPLKIVCVALARDSHKSSEFRTELGRILSLGWLDASDTTGPDLRLHETSPGSGDGIR